VTLVRKYGGKKKFVGIPAELYDQVERFATKGKYTLNSVVETALEDFLDVDPDAGAGELVPAPAPTNGMNGHHAQRDRVVVVKVDGMTERLALVVDESPKPGFKTIRLQDGRSPTKFSTAVRRVVEAEIMREATLEERLKGLSL
jgi:hypothetical protein